MRKTRLLVVSGTFRPPIVLISIDIDVIPFLLAEHDHAFGTLDTLVRFVFAPDRGLGWRESASGRLDIGDSAIIADHIFVGCAAVVGDPESGANTTAWRAFWQVFWDVVAGYSLIGSAEPQLSVKDCKMGVNTYWRLVVKMTRFSRVTLLTSLW